MKYHIITPMARFDNYKNIKSMLESYVSGGIDLSWEIITDSDSDVRVDSPLPWINSYKCPNEGEEFWKRCNYSINWYLDTINIADGDRYLFLNDDDSVDEKFFNKLNEISYDNEVIICSMQRGISTPVDAEGPRAHPTNTLIASKENMIPCSVGIEQIILSGKVLKNYRLPLHVWGDGMFIQTVTEENKTFYAKNIYSLFNRFEKGRW